MRIETVVYEKVAVKSSAVAPILVTSLVLDKARSQMVEESHVFFPGSEVYLQRMRYRKLPDSIDCETLSDCVEATRHLYFRHLAASSSEAEPEAGTLANAGGDFERLEVPPFYRFKLENKFLHEMGEIQEWTTSTELRRNFAEVMSYRSDRSEADMLARIFQDDRSTTPAERGHASHTNLHQRFAWTPPRASESGQ